MANISSDQSDFDFWEFVSCAKCQLSFSLDAGVAIPFWLTQCGHVICNNHLNPDQSCSHCGLQGIQLAPLQKEMDSPMSDWFRSMPSSLDLMAFTAKFQQDTMASQIRYFKTRYQQLRHLVERFKRDLAELKKTNGILQSENDQFRMQMGQRHDDQVPSNTFNSNGKRQMSAHQFDFSNRRPMTNSSPRSIPTPLGPNRLTLAPGRQQLRELSARAQHNPLDRSHVYEQENQTQGDFVNPPKERPISSRSLEQYAYVPIDLPHTNLKTFQSTNQLQNEVLHQGRNQGQSAMVPATSRFIPALGSKSKSQFPSKGVMEQGFPRQTNMGPPPTPQRFHPHNNATDNLLAKSKSTNHLVPPPSHRQNLKSQMFSTSDPRGSSSRPSVPNTARGEHRRSFVPEGIVGQQGFN